MSQRACSLSVVIPTHNRATSLRRLLLHLSLQTLPRDDFEVIVVDDGSTDDTAAVVAETWPFMLRSLGCENRGATRARNHGASAATSEALVFVDDDMAPVPEALAALRDACRANAGTIVLGQLAAPCDGPLPEAGRDGEADCFDVPCTHCATGLLAVRRTDFVALGGFEDPTGGWPSWDDVDFGYRAHLAGMRIVRCRQAVAVHWDDSSRSLAATCDRWRRAGHSAVRLFHRFPDLAPAMPMFADKRPIDVRHDQPRLVVRKMARRVSATRPALRMMELGARFAGARGRPGRALRRWATGGHLYRGYREGVRDFGEPPAPAPGTREHEG